MFFYHFLQLCPRGHISKMLAVTVIENTVTKRLFYALEKKMTMNNIIFLLKLEKKVQIGHYTCHIMGLSAKNIIKTPKDTMKF